MTGCLNNDYIGSSNVIAIANGRNERKMSQFLVDRIRQTAIDDILFDREKVSV